ncbi:MAG: SPOR domain-containing protein [Thiotrichaceae bacterium]
MGNDGISTVTLPAKPLRPLPASFTFLDLDGNPMGKEQLAIEEEAAANAAKKSAETATAGWLVQAASFRTEKSANKWAGKLKEKGFDVTITKMGNRLIVHLTQIQTDKATAQKLSKQITAETGLKHVKIRENKPQQ